MGEALIVRRGGGGGKPYTGANPIVPSTANQVIPAGTFIKEALTIQGDADFKAENIRQNVNMFGKTGTLKEGIQVTIDGVTQKNDLALTTALLDRPLTVATPNTGNWWNTVVFRNELHIVGGSNGNGLSLHSKFVNDTSWTTVSTLPISMSTPALVEFNDELHMVGNSIGQGTDHYKWNGSSWTQVSTLPYPFYDATGAGGRAIVFRNEIHIFGGSTSSTSYRKNHYKWNGSSWTQVSTLPFEFTGGAVVVYEDELHLMSKSSNKEHYKWNGSSWTQVSTLPTLFVREAAIIDGELRIYNNNGDKKRYRFKGTTWEEYGIGDYHIGSNRGVKYKEEFHVLNQNSSSLHVVYDRKFLSEV